MTPAQRIGAILAGLRLLERATDEYDGPSSRTVVSLAGIGDVLTNCGAHAAPTAQEIDALCEEINGRRPESVPLAALDWRDSSEDQPRSRLLATVEIGGVRLHLEAYLAVDSDSVQQFPGDFGDTADKVYEAVGADGAWQTVEIEGREYVLIATPYAQ